MAQNKVKIFADGANLQQIESLAGNAQIEGFTTNPSLMRSAGVQRYRAGAENILKAARGKPVSIEVLSDDEGGMRREAKGIAALAKNAVVKIPVVNSSGESTSALISSLCGEGVSLNVTAVFTIEQVRVIGEALGKTGDVPVIVSVFAGRIADTGVDPLAHMTECRRTLRRSCPRAQMLWASPRQVYDLRLAEKAGCDIITMTPDLLKKLELTGKDLEQYSRETAAQFYHDAQAASYTL